MREVLEIPELLNYILCFLHPSQLALCMRVNRSINRVANDEQIWRAMCEALLCCPRSALDRLLFDRTAQQLFQNIWRGFSASQNLSVTPAAGLSDLHAHGYGALRIPLSITTGRWLIEITVIRRDWAMGVGVVAANIVDSFPLDADVEYEKGWFGFYHGGGETGSRLVNLVCDGRRLMWDFNSLRFHQGDRVGVLIDMDAVSPTGTKGLLALTNRSEPIGVQHWGLPDGCQPLIWLYHEEDEAVFHFPKCC
eukprot:TRINITY_DN81511_c0_g1_i1.p1 TRINITY_DN81511_c0_g1~~TRINITY_DN81511_c0_g1_i1.p1  ORF type:complete len:260 (-),score=24.31 TRINITY_DN81511_c0_g1_i1:8-760(-)